MPTEEERGGRIGKSGLYLRSLLASWTGYGAEIAVMFFLSPFVVHSLGDSRYGLWSLLMTVTGYLGLAEIGVRASTGRFINYHLGQKQREQVSYVVNTSLAFYLAAGLLIAAVALVVGRFFGALFPKIDVGQAGEVQAVLLLMALNVWLGLWGATFGQLLYANNRFDLTNGISIIVLGVRACGTVLVLVRGWGLAQLAGALVVATAVQFVLLVAAARWKGVRVRYGLGLTSWKCLRELLGFGVWSCLAAAAARFKGYASAAIIGVLLGAAEITYYAIGYMLIDSAKELLTHIVRVLTPDMQKSAGARGDMGALMAKATNATMFLAVPILVGLLALGGEFIRNWMGPGYERSAYVLILITASQFTNVANMSCGTILNAMGHVRLLAALSGLEAVLNLVLSVVLVEFFDLGIYGVALGLAAPSLVMMGVVQMVVACRRTGIRVAPYVRATSVRWAIAVAALLPAGLLLSRALGTGGWGLFCTKGALLVAIYLPLGLGVVLGWSESRQLLERLHVLRPRPEEPEEALEEARSPD